MRAVAALAVLSTSYAFVCLSCAAGNEDDEDIPTGPVTSATSTTGAGGSTATTTTTTASATSTTSTTTTASATTDAASATSDAATSSGACATYAHTIAIDGTNDFAADETFNTSSAMYTGYVAWDASYVYLGMRGADIASATPTKFFFVYLGTGAGTTDGVTYNTQQPILPFPASHHVRWKADNTFTGALRHDGAAWVDAGWPFTGGVHQSGDFLELRVARADLGSPNVLDVAFGMLNEGAAVEATYAGVPASAYTDGYDPNLFRRYSFDLGGCDAPATYTAL